MKHLPHDENLTEELHSEAQRAVGAWVKALPDEEPSMAWRAQLNERLRSMPGAAKRAWWQLTWKPAAGLALAATLTFVVFFRPHPAAQATSGLEVAEVLVAAHGQSVAQMELGMAPVESLRSDVAMPTEWEEVDLGTL